MEKRSSDLGRFFEQTAPVPLALDRSVGDQILDALKLAILRMDIVPGALISETEVAQMFDASRTPVREAFAQLRAAGLVVTSVGRGNFATKLSKPRIEEACFIREVVELGVVDAICTQGLGIAHRGRILQILEAQKHCVNQGDKQGFREQDDQFHIALAQATGYPRMAEILEREKMVLDRLRVLSLDQKDHMHRLYEEHLGIFEALDRHDKDSARRLMKAHLMTVLTTLSALQTRNQDYF